jgi:hypothetical protein
MFEENEDLKAIGGQVYEWLFHMWARDTIIGIRRELDDDRNTISFGTLLDEMAERPTILTRRKFTGYSTGKEVFIFQMLDEAFDRYGIVKAADRLDDHIDPKAIRADRRQLDRAAKPVTDYANRLVAHRTPIDEMPLTYGQLNAAMDAMEPAFTKYYAVVNGGALMGLEPAMIGEWTKPFTIPWVKPQG